MRKKTKKGLSLLLATATIASTIGLASVKTVSAEGTELDTITIDANYTSNTYLDVQGRTYYDTTNGGLALHNSASGFAVRFTGTELNVSWKYFDTTEENKGDGNFCVFVDGSTDPTAKVVQVDCASVTTNECESQVLVEGLTEGEHTVRVLKRNAASHGTCIVKSVTTDGEFLEVKKDTRLKVEVFGDSITMGFGVLRDNFDEGTQTYVDKIDDNAYMNVTESIFQSYAGYMAQELDARLNVFGRDGAAMKYSYTPNYTNSVLNRNQYVFMDKSDTPMVDYDYSTYTPDVVVIYLGTNDWFQRDNVSKLGDGKAFSVEGLKAGFEAFIRETIGRNYGKDIPIFLCSGMMAPESNLPAYMEDVKNRLVGEFPNLETVEFEACAVGHPVAAEAEVAGKKLANAIQNKLDTLKNQ